MHRIRPWKRTVAIVAAAALGGGLGPAAGVAAAATTGTYVSDPASLVNPFIGTTNGGDTFPGADTPFGMVQWSPDTTSRPEGGGYSYDDNAIIGYSLDHLSGPGCPAEGDVPILPTTGAIGSDPASATEPLVHSAETATPGSYSLDAGGITTQLTATTRTGMASFTFPTGSATGNLLFKLDDSATPDTNTSFRVVNPEEVEGSVTSGGFCGATNSYTLHFDMVFNQPISASGTWSSGGQGAYVTFDTSSASTVLAKVGVSYVSNANAMANLEAENPNWDFGAIQAKAHQDWNDQLSKVQIGGGTPQQQTVFYTALYHSLLHPNVFSDVNGQYMGFDGQVHQAPAGHPVFANYSGWDIYRSQVQLVSMLDPSIASDIVTSMLDDYNQTGQFPKWSEDNGETYVMVGDPSDAIIADAYAFGARGFNAQQALSDMIKEATVPNNNRPGLDYYESDGYLPIDGTYGCCNFYGPVSTQEEYNAADNAIALLASAEGKASTAQQFATRANNWQNVFNPGSGFLQPKEADGVFEPGFDPTSSNGFVEADAYVYTAELPFDVQGIIRDYGGDAAWVQYLNQMFTSVTAMGPTQVQMGNEPSFDIPWEYDYAGAPYRTQETVREVQDQLYTDTPGGLAGNDDLGAMSSWYVFSALGMYPEMPGSSTMALGSPMFTDIAVHLGNGKTITESAPAAADDAPYVQALTVNGASSNSAALPGSTLMSGPTLDWTLGTSPDTSWASAASSAPPSNTHGLLPALGFAQASGGSQAVVSPGTDTNVTLGVQNTTSKGEEVHWTASVSSPSGGSTSGITVGPDNGTIGAAAEAKGTQPVAVDVASGAADGRYLVTFSLQTARGVTLPDVVVEVDVAAPGDLTPYLNNTGISDDSNQGTANFDGDGFSYSAEALAAAGVEPGGTITVGGVQYTWPDAAAGTPDNVIAGGQDIAVQQVSGASSIGVVGSATNGPSTGTMTITYTDGSTSTVDLGLSDWTLGAGSSQPSYGNATVASMPYRNSVSGSSQQVGTYVFAATFPIASGKTVASVTLPSSVNQGELHVFAVGSDKGPLTTAS